MWRKATRCIAPLTYNSSSLVLVLALDRALLRVHESAYPRYFSIAYISACKHLLLLLCGRIKTNLARAGEMRFECGQPLWRRYFHWHYIAWLRVFCQGCVRLSRSLNNIGTSHWCIMKCEIRCIYPRSDATLTKFCPLDNRPIAGTYRSHLWVSSYCGPSFHLTVLK